MIDRQFVSRLALLTVVALAPACGPVALPTAPDLATTSAASGPPGQSAGSAQTARYQITIDATWSAATHPSDFPAAAHFSPIVGGTHNPRVVFWQAGSLASAGIQSMAERGAKSPLEAEVAGAIASGTAEFVISGGDIGRTPGSVSVEVSVSQAFPLVTLVTMVAPSPDWFIGVTGLPLFESGAWRERVTVELFPWDAGTDSGLTFRSADEDARPHVPVFQISGFPFAHQGRVAPLGTMTFRRIQ